jgi:hypothetical protein
MILTYSLILMIAIKPVHYGVALNSFLLMISYQSIIYFQTFNTFKLGKFKNKITDVIIQ